MHGWRPWIQFFQPAHVSERNAGEVQRACAAQYERPGRTEKHPSERSDLSTMNDLERYVERIVVSQTTQEGSTLFAAPCVNMATIG